MDNIRMKECEKYEKIHNFWMWGIRKNSLL